MGFARCVLCAPLLLFFAHGWLQQQCGHALLRRRELGRATTICSHYRNDNDDFCDDDDPFALFCSMRIGCSPDIANNAGNNNNNLLCNESVIWVGSGQVFQAFSGKVLAHWEGIDIGKGICMTTSNDDDDNNNSSGNGDDSNNDNKRVVVRQLSRKLFWFRDAVTGEIMDSYKGQPVKPIRYECQVFDFERDPAGDPSTTIPSVVFSNRHVPVLPITHRKLPCSSDDHVDIHLFQAPVFVDLPPFGPGQPPYRAFEFYDYTVSTANSASSSNNGSDETMTAPTPTASWCRQGPVAPFSALVEDPATNPTVMKGTAFRVNTFAQVPKHIQQYIVENDPMFQDPPLDMEEVREWEQKQQNRKPAR